MPQQLAEPPSAPAPVEVEGGEIGSLSCLLAVALLGAPGGHVDPVTVIQTGQTSFQPNTEFMREIQRTLNQAVSDSGVPGPPTCAAYVAVGERPTSSAARRRRGHGRRRKTLHKCHQHF